VTARILADLVLTFHFAFIIFAVLGGILVLWKAWIAWLQVPSVLWSGYVNLFGQVCPLTPLENRFRYLTGQAGYEGGFIQHYIAALVYPGVMPERWGLVSGLSVLIWNVLVYTLVVTRRRGVPLRRARPIYRGSWRVGEREPHPTTGAAREGAESASWWRRMFGR
jgi:Protein of Unknown function (DUF2784)